MSIESDFEQGFPRYRKGAVTPTFSGSTGTAGTAATTTATGFFTRVGNLVQVELALVISNLGSWTGDLIISGLPYNVTDPSPSWTAIGSSGVPLNTDVATGLGNVVSIVARALTATKTVKFTYRTAASAAPAGILQAGAGQTAAGFICLVGGSYYTSDPF